MKIASLIASSTEIACALGLEKNLVARSHECDFPLSVRKLPQVTRPRFAVEGTSREIDERVKKSVLETPADQAVSIYEIDRKVLQSLEPDVILTQSQCEVCAVSLSEVEAAVAGWLGKKPRLVSLQPNALADIWLDIKKVAEATGVTQQGERLITSLKGRMSGAAKVGKILSQKRGAPLKVACIEWIDPLMAAGNWMPELVEMAGGINLFGEAGKHSPWMTLDQLSEKDPDVIIVMPCGFDLRKTAEEFPTLQKQEKWNSLRAVQENHVYLADGNQYFNRPGPRVTEALEILLEILYPGKVDAGHEGTGWCKVPGRL